MFCSHNWQPRTGMDGGSVCGVCGKVSNKEIVPNSNSGLSSGRLQKSSNMFLDLISRVAPSVENKHAPEKQNRQKFYR